MRSPLAAISGRLAWARDGSCWSFSRLQPLPYSPAAPANQVETLQRLFVSVASIEDEFSAWGLCEPITPADYEEQMLRVSGRASWRETVRANVATLDPFEQRFRRAYFLAVRLPGISWRTPLLMDARASVPPEDVRVAAWKKAATLDRRLGMLHGRPAKAAEIGWIVTRTLNRGRRDDLPIIACPEWLTGDALAELGVAVVTNGGVDRAEDGEDQRVLGHWALVDTKHGRSYQSVIAVETAPQEFEPPGSEGEWIARVERECPHPVDWFVSGRVEAADQASKKVRWQLRQIAGQYAEHAGDAAQIPPSLQEAWRSLKRMEGEISSEGHGGVWFTSLFTVADTDPTSLERQVEDVRSVLAGEKYALPTMPGRHAGLIRAQLPGHRYDKGIARRSALWRYRQSAMPTGLAGAGMFCGSACGDRSGIPIGVDVHSGVRPPVFWWPGLPATVNQSPTIVICGELGSGKSKLAKRMVGEGLIPAGGQFLSVDCTSNVKVGVDDAGNDIHIGEWVQFAKAVKGSTVIDLAGSTVAFDPTLMPFPDQVKHRMLTGLVMTGGGWRFPSLEADIIDRAVRMVVESGWRAAHLAPYLRNDEGWKDDPVAQQVATRIENLGRVMPGVFAVNLAAPDLTASYVVFAAAGLKLPTRLELTNRDLSEQLSIEKRAGQAMLMLAADIAKEVGWHNGKPTLIGFDEAWRISASPYGIEILTEISTEGRRYDTGLLAVLQNPARLPPDVLGLAGMVVALRAKHHDETQSSAGPSVAEACAAAVGVPTEMITALRTILDPETGEAASGFGYVRDLRGQITLVAFGRPVDPFMDAMSETTVRALDEDLADEVAA